MEQIDGLYIILNEFTELYDSFIKIEYDKYNSIITDDIKTLDEIISKEQVFYLKMKGLEQRLDKFLNSMDMKDKTLKQIIDLAKEEDCSKLKLIYDKLLKLINDFKKINKECKTLIEVRLHKIDKAMSELGEKKNTYSNINSPKDNLKSLIVSKKI